MVVQQLIGRSAAPPDPVRLPQISSGPKLSHAVAARGLFVELQSWKSSEYFSARYFFVKRQRIHEITGNPCGKRAHPVYHPVFQVTSIDVIQ